MRSRSGKQATCQGLAPNGHDAQRCQPEETWRGKRSRWSVDLLIDRQRRGHGARQQIAQEEPWSQPFIAAGAMGATSSSSLGLRPTFPAADQPEEEQPVPDRAGHFSGDWRKRGINPALVLEPALQHLHGNGSATHVAHQDCSRWRDTRIARTDFHDRCIGAIRG
jgi:hypothetical protein